MIVNISLILKDKTEIPFSELSGTYKKDDVLGVLVMEDNIHPFIVSPTSFEADMLYQKDDCKLYGKAFKRECDAIVDYDSKTNTDAMFEGGCHAAVDVRENLGAEWDIPALGILNCMCRHMETINKVLEKVENADLLRESITWSSTEYSSTFAWYVNFGTGHTNNGYHYYKYSTFVVRPVSAYL